MSAMVVALVAVMTDSMSFDRTGWPLAYSRETLRGIRKPFTVPSRSADAVALVAELRVPFAFALLIALVVARVVALVVVAGSVGPCKATLKSILLLVPPSSLYQHRWSPSSGKLVKCSARR